MSQKNMNIAKEETQKKINLKVIIPVLAIIIGLIVIVLITFNIMKKYLTTAKTIEFNWGITIPSDLKEEYHINTESSFGGDGERYSIFNGSKFIMDFNNERSEELEKRISELNNKLNISKENQIGKYRVICFFE